MPCPALRKRIAAPALLRLRARPLRIALVGKRNVGRRLVFLCEQTELALERSVAEIILVRTVED
jgi:hypothetical protein